MMEKREYQYYAFISYSRTDEKWAKWIQRKLETYRFPISLRRENRDLPGKIFPVFRDKTDLPSGVLWEQLKHQLEESEYLIVICSPESARAEWVTKEIAYFQELGRNRNIIPLIVEGEPHAADSARECYNPALLARPDEELLGVSVRELGRSRAVLRVIASLMRLRYDQLVMRDRRRTRKRRLLAACFLTAFLAACAGGVWYEMPHSAYYWSYVYRNEVPVGLVEVSGRERKTAHDYYKIVTRRGRVIRLERVNSVGTVTDGAVTFALDELPYIEYSYGEEGNLDTVTQKTDTGDVELVKSYTQSLNAVDFQNPHDDTGFGTLAANQSTGMGSELSELLTGKSEIARQLQEYDENGYLTQILYMWDNRNTPVCDKNGIYGKQYIRDEEGKIKRVVHLGKDGEPLRVQYGGTSVAFTDYEYDSCGRIVRYAVYDAEGNPTLDEENVFCWEYRYDESGCVTQACCLDAAGNLAPNLGGVSQYVLQYDEKGFLTDVSAMDAAGNLACDKEVGVFRTVYQHDQKGRRTAMRYYDASGNPAVGGIEGYAGASWEYDEQGRIVAMWYYGLDGELACAADHYNEAGFTKEFRDEERILRWTYYDRDGNVAVNRMGYAIEVDKSNAQGLTVETAYYDAAGNPVRSCYNAATIVYEYNNAAQLVSISYFDENGMPCSNQYGAAVIRREYDRDGNQIRQQFYDAEGEPCYVNYEGGNYVRREAEYGIYGWATRIRYYDKDGEVIQVDGTCDERMEYDERGNCIRYAYYDYKGSLRNNSAGYAIEELTYDEKGRLTADRYWDQDGLPVTGRDYAEEMEYDERGNLLRRVSHVLEEDGAETLTVTCYEYDERDNLIRQYLTDKQGRLCADENGVAVYEWTKDECDRSVIVSYSNAARQLINCVEADYNEKNQLVERRYYDGPAENGGQERSYVGRVTYAYDDYGNQTEVWKYNKNDEVITDSDGIACTVRTYNVKGECIRETFCDSARQIIAGSAGYAVKEMTYDAVGRVIRYDCYDEKEEPMTQASGQAATFIQRYDDLGNLTESISYNESGEFFRYEDGTSRIVYFYDEKGLAAAKQYYDDRNRLKRTSVMTLCVEEVTEGSAADLAGVEEYDIIVQYDNWCFFDYDDFTETSFGELTSAMTASVDRSRTVRVCKRDSVSDDGEFVFQEYTLGAGSVGLSLRAAWFDEETMERMRSRYGSWAGKD